MAAHRLVAPSPTATPEREAKETETGERRIVAAGPEPCPGPLSLTELPGELLELILCCGVLRAVDVGSLACTCRRLREACQPSGKVWREQFRLRWPSLMKHYNQADTVNWLEECKERHKAGVEAQRIVASFSERFFSEHVPCDGFSDIETLGCPRHFFVDELMSILKIEGRPSYSQNLLSCHLD